MTDEPNDATTDDEEGFDPDGWVAERYPPHDYTSDMDQSLDDEDMKLMEAAYLEPTRRMWPGGFEYEITNGAARDIDGTFAMLPERRFYADGREKPGDEEFFDLVHRLLFIERRAHGHRVDVATALMAVRAFRRHVDRLEHEAIAIARGWRWSWRSIGGVLGVDASVLHKRYAKKIVPKRRKRKRGGAR